MTADPLKKALPVLISVCVAITLVGAIYFIAQYRSERPAEAAQTVRDPAWMRGGAQAEPLEAGGVEGVLTNSGFLVTALDGPGRTWGLQLGDTIRAVGDRPVRSALQIRALAPGVPMQVERNGKVSKIKAGEGVTLLPADVRTVDVRGLVGQVTPEGLWVTSVEGNAAAWGLRAGDLVRTVDGRPLTVRRDVTSFLRSLNPNDGFVFEIVRDGARLYLPYNTHNPVRRPEKVAMTPPSTFWAQPGQGPALMPGAPQAPAGLNPGLGPNCQSRQCPSCGVWHGPYWARGQCWRCGSALAPANSMPGYAPMAGAGVGQGFQGGAPVGPCGQVPRRLTGGW